jgi:putative addiction module component (TIGR02574 family)
MNEVTMRRPELWAELMELTPEERIELVEDLWDSIAEEKFPPLTPEQTQEIERRDGEHAHDPDRASKWEDVKARLLARLK